MIDDPEYRTDTLDRYLYIEGAGPSGCCGTYMDIAGITFIVPFIPTLPVGGSSLGADSSKLVSLREKAFQVYSDRASVFSCLCAIE